MKQNLLFFTSDIEKAKQEISSLGGQVTQQFTDKVFIANLPDAVDFSSISQSSLDQPDDLDPVSQLTVDAWRQTHDSESTPTAVESEGLSWDAEGYMPPSPPDHDHINHAPSPSDILEHVHHSTGTPTSLYMTGSIAVGVVIVSGTRSDLSLSSSENTKVIQEVQKGLTFLANAEPRANITFVYDIRLVTVSVAPGSTASYESAEGPWRNAALQSMGYAPTRNSSIEYVQDLQRSRGTDWAFVAYFTKYPLRHFAYAVYEKTVMHYGNDGWGVHNIHKVFAHEACHIFGAADEYGSCSCGGSHGYLGVPNNNCVNCSGARVSCLMDGNVLELCSWSRRQIGWDTSLFPGKFPPLSRGNFTIQQKNNNRFLDAHTSSSNDFSVVTRSQQNNDTQRWKFNPAGTIYTLEQKSSHRFVDAHEHSGADFSLVTRTAQNNDTQRWAFLQVPHKLSTYTIQQLSNGRFMDAYTGGVNDHNVVSRAAQHNSSQQWILSPLGNDTYTLQQATNNRYLDAHESSGNDFSLVTRTAQNNDTQRWILKPIGAIYTIQQLSNDRFLDAHEASDNDFSIVTRTAQNNNTQHWAVLSLGNQTYTVQQLSNGRFMDAHVHSGADFSVVTRTRQDNDTQKWVIKAV